ncbi:hypothetical protein TWF481_005289 [Arthrobotrys musiformis]|uniref:Uncharacterized protein n=1 Tax=Arthrobotrys musiformis TaxID=47236 RepID=A0AAV9WFC4_9PEZI
MRYTNAYVIFNSPNSRPKVDVIFFYTSRTCEQDPVVVVKLKIGDGLQVIDFQTLGIKVYPGATRGFQLHDRAFAPYLADAPGASTGVWYYDHPLGKFVWVNAVTPTIIESPLTNLATGEGAAAQQALPVNEAIEADYQEWRRKNPYRSDARPKPVIDPYIGNRLLPTRYQDMVTGFKAALWAGGQNSWFAFHQNVYNMARNIFSSWQASCSAPGGTDASEACQTLSAQPLTLVDTVAPNERAGGGSGGTAILEQNTSAPKKEEDEGSGNLVISGSNMKIEELGQGGGSGTSSEIVFKEEENTIHDSIQDTIYDNNSNLDNASVKGEPEAEGNPEDVIKIEAGLEEDQGPGSEGYEPVVSKRQKPSF